MKITTVKPSDYPSLSIMSSVCDGIHPVFDPTGYFIRRIKIRDKKKEAEIKKKTIEDSEVFKELNKRII